MTRYLIGDLIGFHLQLLQFGFRSTIFRCHRHLRVTFLGISPATRKMTEKWGNRKRQKYKIKENEGDKTLLVVLVLLSYRGKRINDRFSPRRFMWMKDNRLMHRIISSGQIIGSGPEGGEALSLLRRYPTDTINPDDKLQVDSAGRRAHAELRIDRQNMTGVDKKKALLFSLCNEPEAELISDKNHIVISRAMWSIRKTRAPPYRARAIFYFIE